MDRNLVGIISIAIMLGLIFVCMVLFCSLVFLVGVSGIAIYANINSQVQADPEIIRSETVLENTLPKPFNTEPSAAEPINSAFAELGIDQNELFSQVVTLRGLEPTAEITYYQASTTALLNTYSNLYPAHRQRADNSALHLLGLPTYSPDFTAPAFSTLLVPGKENSMSIHLQLPASTTELQSSLVLAITQSLLRQNFQTIAESNCPAAGPLLGEDRCLALKALLTGDASNLLEQWLRYYSNDPDTIAPTTIPIHTTDSLSSDMTAFTQFDGHSFTRHHIREDAWPSIDSLYARVPISTHQILHPEHYPFRKPVELIPVDGILPALGENWFPSHKGVLGEWYTYRILAEFLDADIAQAAASGWDGDSFQTFTTYDGSDTLILWVVQWHTIAETYTARTAFHAYAESRFNVDPAPTRESCRVSTEPAFYMQRDDNQILLIFSTDAAKIDPVLAAIRFPLRSQ